MNPLRLPFNGHTVLQTRDVDTAEQALSRCYLPLRLRSARPGAQFEHEVEHHRPGSRDRRRAQLRQRGPHPHRGSRQLPCRHAAVGTGRLTSLAAAHQVVTKPGSAQVFTPGERADLHWSTNTQQLCVMVEKFALDRHLLTLLGADLSRPLMFKTTMDLRGPGGGTWMHVLRLVERELRRDDGLLGHPTMRRNPRAADHRDSADRPRAQLLAAAAAHAGRIRLRCNRDRNGTPRNPS